MLRLVLLLAVVALAAGCGAAGGPPPTPPEPPRIPTGAPPSPGTGRPTPVPDPLTAAPPAGTTALAADRVEAGDLPAGFPTLVWARGPRTVGVYGKAGGCVEARVEVLEQAADHVTLRVVQYSTGPGPCTRELRYPPLEVSLAADLGERRVVLRGTAV